MSSKDMLLSSLAKFVSLHEARADVACAQSCPGGDGIDRFCFSSSGLEYGIQEAKGDSRRMPFTIYYFTHTSLVIDSGTIKQLPLTHAILISKRPFCQP